MAVGDKLKSLMEFNNPGAHNGIYRGKYLGSSYTAAQQAAVAAGTFEDLYLGDYWTIPVTINGSTVNVNWRIVDFDYFMNHGDDNANVPNVRQHHIVVMPDAPLYYKGMNDTNITTDGYAGSKMRTEYLADAKTAANAAFGNRILKHRILICNSVTDGKPSGWAWADGDIEIPSEWQIYGASAWGAFAGNGYQAGTQVRQFALFAFVSWVFFGRVYFWLQDVVSATHFAVAGAYGNAANGYASHAYGVRPYIPIY